MAITKAFPGFDDLRCTVGDPSFSFDGSFSLPIFCLERKNEENLSTRSLNVFSKCMIEILFSSSFIGAAVSNTF